jgi:adenylosuccinate lyase
MAQKRNPINTENICSNVRVIRSCIYPSLENIALEHERDLTNSAAERSIIPTVFILADEVLTRMNKILKELVVYPKNIKKNLDLSKGTIMSEAIITKLVEKGMGRQDAHELLRESSMKAFETDKNLKEILLTKVIVKRYITEKELDELFDYNNYIGLSVEKTEKVINKWRSFI